MYATTRTYAAGDLAEALVQNADEVKRIISEIDGFRAYYLIRTAAGAVSVSVFDDQAGVDESTTVAANWLGENLPNQAGSPPDVASGEVVLSF